jgi:enhancing lycopene biosynthesis protein 2
MTNVAVILAGCGHLDGAEIREAVLSLLYLSEAGAKVEIFAPNIIQHHTINHLTGEESEEGRNVLVEAARIARGEIKPLSELNASGFDALVLPGGFGVAKNCSDLAFNGKDAQVLPEYAKAINAFHNAGKPIAAICIAPAVLAKVLGASHPTVTIGTDTGTAGVVESFGAKHQTSPTNKAVVDEKNRIATTPAYMHQDSLADVGKGIKQAIEAVLRMAANKAKAA